MQEGLGAIDFLADHRAERVVCLAPLERGVGIPMAVTGVAREVAAVAVRVTGHVLPEVGQLQAGANGVRKLEASLIRSAAEIEDEASNGICGITAVVEQFVHRFVAARLLVPAEGDEQIEKGLAGNRKRFDRLL